MALNFVNSKTCKDGVKLDVERLKRKYGIQKVNVKLSKTSINTLSTLVIILSEYVKLYMKLLAANRYYALNDRTIHCLSQGEIDMSATTADFGSTPASNTVCDANIVDSLDTPSLRYNIPVFLDPDPGKS